MPARPQRNKQGPGQALLIVNTNIHDNPPAVPRSPPQSPAVPRSPASPALELVLGAPLSLVWVCGGSAGGRARLIVRWAAALFSFHQRNSGARLVGDV